MRTRSGHKPWPPSRTTQAGLTIILASLAPFTLFWYVSGDNYQAAILFNALMFAVASISAQFLLYRSYRPLIANRPVHLKLFRIWLILYAFVGIQMGWVLRPFVGDPSKPVQFFRQGAWGNAYVELAYRAQGDTQAAALENANEAIQLWIDTAKEFGDPVPEPKGQRLMLA